MSSGSVATRDRLPPQLQITLEIFERVPPWAVVCAARDGSSEPLIKAGEVAIVKSNGRTGYIPSDGELCLIEYESPSLQEQLPHLSGDYPSRRRRPRSLEIVQVRRHVHPRTGDETWSAEPYCRPRSLEEAERQMARTGVIYCADGPYPTNLDIAEKLLGPVVGIYRPVWRDSD